MRILSSKFHTQNVDFRGLQRKFALTCSTLVHYHDPRAVYRLLFVCGFAPGGAIAADTFEHLRATQTNLSFLSDARMHRQLLSVLLLVLAVSADQQNDQLLEFVERATPCTRFACCVGFHAAVLLQLYHRR